MGPCFLSMVDGDSQGRFATFALAEADYLHWRKMSFFVVAGQEFRRLWRNDIYREGQREGRASAVAFCCGGSA